MSLINLKKVLMTYISCVTILALETTKVLINDINKRQIEALNAIEGDNKEIKQKLLKKINRIKVEIEYLEYIFDENNIERFVNKLLEPYAKRNFFLNADNFINDNIDFLINDVAIRHKIIKDYKAEMEIKNRKKKKKIKLNKKKNNSVKKEILFDNNLLAPTNMETEKKLLGKATTRR